MAWVVPHFSRSEVDAAGAELIREQGDTEELGDYLDRYGDALAIVNNWRSSHGFPLNTFQVNLRRNARRVSPRFLLAQRIKRLAAIELKLERLHRWRLSQIQDIGGCRVVLPTVYHVNRLVEIYNQSHSKHTLHHMDDYITTPRSSGYRGVHLIYQYKSDRANTRAWDNLRIEIQLRSQVQHTWATAVETVGAFVGQALKSSEGEDRWLRFFALMGSVLALREKTSPVPGTSARMSDLRREIREINAELDVPGRLRGYTNALNVPSMMRAKRRGLRMFLMVLDTRAETMHVRGFTMSERQEATDAYLAEERRIASLPGSQAVLVSVDSLAALQRAYPNYFADTRAFIRAVQGAVL
jgi:hypothetical protein